MKEKSIWKVILLSGIGGMLEMYDFIIFIVFAHELGLVFFPKEIGSLATVYTLGVFAVGYLARPIGGMLFAHFGDRYGRKKIFALSIVLMALSTFLIGVLPGYVSWGVIASLLFILFRIIQGLAVGGELPGAITFVYEHVKSHATFAVGVLFCFVNLGILLASVVYAMIYYFLPAADAEAYGWRVAFILGGFLAIVGYYLRKKLNETPEFKAYEKEIKKQSVPIIELFTKHLKSLFSTSLLMALMATIVGLVFLYLTAYLQGRINYTDLEISSLHLFGLVVLPISIIIWSFIGQSARNKKKVYVGIVIVLMIVLIPAYKEIIHHDYQWIAYFVLICLCGGIYALSPTLVADSYPVSVRYNGVAFGYNMAFAIFGGLTPLIANLLSYQKITEIAPAWILLVASIIGLLGLFIGSFKQKRAS